MDKEIFEKEILICRVHYKKKKSCKWGMCEKCGAVPLLHKLYNNEVIDNEEELIKLKDKYLK